MELLFTQLFSTVLLRPYVIFFFLIYFLGCSMHLGVKRSFLFGICGYCIAFLSEYSSIHNGIPYGHYSYIEHTKDKEIWVMGVPFMDSMSYVFLAYASYSMALTVMSPVLYSRGLIYLLETKKLRNSLSVKVLATFFFVYLDIIIDPVALRGNRWFLGQIYEYPVNGVYFGVPISNFIGWFVVGLLLISVLQAIDNFLTGRKIKDWSGYRFPGRYLIGPCLYVSILVLNLSVTFLIREYTLGWVGIFIILLPSVLFFVIMNLKRSHINRQKALHDHLHDFPQALPPLEWS
ncbi:MAG: carotenoid biosynthesis protein [Thermodesulfovibrionia bacterium]|nr:carotenoid biosynthesis protein [Thermodesulfovibrionia bacterium]